MKNLTLQMQLSVLRNHEAVLIRTTKGKVLYEGYVGNSYMCKELKDQEVLEVCVRFQPQKKGTHEKLERQDVEVFSCADVEFVAGTTIVVEG